MTLSSNLAKIISLLYLVVLVGGYALSGWLEDPIQFYASFYGTTIFPTDDIPEPAKVALEHMSMTMTQLSIMFSIWIFLAAWKWKAPRFSMAFGLLYCGTICAAERVVPTPLTNLWKFAGISFSHVDLTPLVFGVLFLLGLLFVVPEQTTTTTTTTTITTKMPMATVCRSWAVIYGNLVLLTMLHVLMNPTHFYTTSLGHTDFFNAEAGVQMLMRRQAFLVAAVQVLHAMVLATQVFALQQQHTTSMLQPLLYFPMVFQLVQILLIQLYYPWQPHSRVFVPLLGEGGTLVIMPPFVVQLLILVGSLGCLHRQISLEEEAHVMAGLENKKKQQ